MGTQDITVSLKKLIEEFSLEVIYGTEDMDERQIRSKDVLRPGMQLATGFFDDLTRSEFLF